MDWLSFHDPVSAGTHLLWLLLSIPATLYLIRKSRGSVLKQIGFAVFGVGLVACYGSSTLWHATRREFLGTLDYISIYVLIGATTTPVILVVLRGVWRWATLTYIWFLGLTGMALCLLPMQLPQTLRTGLYLGMGWGMCVCYFELVRNLSHRKLRLVVVGGIFYSVGAVVYRVGWPELWPGVFGAHELFHVLVMAGSLSHFIFMAKWVVPFQPAPVVEVVPELTSSLGASGASFFGHRQLDG
jgi:hemolysin III